MESEALKEIMLSYTLDSPWTAEEVHIRFNEIAKRGLAHAPSWFSGPENYLTSEEKLYLRYQDVPKDATILQASTMFGDDSFSVLLLYGNPVNEDDLFHFFSERPFRPRVDYASARERSRDLFMRITYI